MSATSPITKGARHQRIIDLVTQHEVRSQTDLVQLLAEEGVKVTLALSRRSVEFFKAEASKHHTQYQRMIRRLLDAYVEAQQGAAESGKSGRARGARRSGGAAR